VIQLAALHLANAPWHFANVPWHFANAPWNEPLTQAQYLIVFYFLVVAALALFAGFIRTWVTQNEVGSRYRSATVARISITGVAGLSYLFLIVCFVAGYRRLGTHYVPTEFAVLTLAGRYMEWSVTVPILALAILTVCTFTGRAARRVQVRATISAFLMVFCGFVGGFLGGATDPAMMFWWGVTSSVFFALTIAILLRAVRASLPNLTPESQTLLRYAVTVLIAGWFVYPLVYAVQLVAAGGEWTASIQVLFCIADVALKLGFGGLIHRIAKLRTAEDVRAGDDIHPEAIWISSIKQSDAGSPREVYLADGSAIHAARTKPPLGVAVASRAEDGPPQGY
jgi:bacteriorhodopsin